MPEVARKALMMLLAAAALFYVYSPALTQRYFYHDDVNFFLTTPHQPYPKSYQLSLAIGRFVGAPIYALQGRLIRHVADLNSIRWIGFIQLLLCAALLTRLMRRSGWPVAPAWVLAVLIITLPAFQVLLSLAGYAFQITGALLGLVAVTLADLVPVDKWRRMSQSGFAVLAMLCFLAAIATHPSTAMFYWTATALVLVRFPSSPLHCLIRKAAVLFGSGVITMAGYGLLLKLTRHVHPPAELGFYNPYDLNTDIGAKAVWFFKEPLVNALNLWNIFPSAFTAGVAAAALGTVGLIIGLAGRRTPAELVVRIGILTALPVLSFSTNLLAVSDAPFYRCCMALTAIVLLYGFAAGIWLCERLPAGTASSVCLVLSVVVAIPALGSARHTLARFRVLPSKMETRLIVDEMRERNVFQYKRVHVVQPDRKKLRNRYDEFGGPTASFRGDLVGLVIAGIREQARGRYQIAHLEYNVRNKMASLVLKDKNGEQLAYHVTITGGRKSTPIHGTTPTLILDIPRLYTRDGPLFYLNKND